MTDENQFFRPVRDFCQSSVETCRPDDRLVEVVGVMRQKNISSLVVCDGDTPVGIITDRDLRNKVVANDALPSNVKVSEIMNSPLSVIGEDDLLYQALYQMSRLRIHRLGVVDANSRLSGIITDTDILRQQAHSPHQLVLDIEKASGFEDLGVQHSRIQDLAIHLSGTGMQTRDTVRLIAHLNDQVLKRLVALLREDRFPDLPECFAFVVLGSEGRGEQTLSTDQDNAIVYANDASDADVARIKAFSEDLIESLIGLGVPPCPGGIMAKNDEWRRSLGVWQREVDRWMTTPSPENILKSSMFADIRTICGDPSFERELKARMFSGAAENRSFLMHMAKNMTNFAPPLGWFGRIKTERKGEHRGKLDIKKAGIFAITEGVKALSLERGQLDGSTHDRLDVLEREKVISTKQQRDLVASFEFLVRLRLRGQVDLVRSGREPNNYLMLEQLTRMERGRLEIALEEVRNFQRFIGKHFRLDLLR